MKQLQLQLKIIVNNENKSKNIEKKRNTYICMKERKNFGKEKSSEKEVKIDFSFYKENKRKLFCCCCIQELKV
ncbi:hypothetical protein DOY81_011887 [Sarcophaga bullata]|nr:hypothetical protein DOY81_011887 [Sarcophaga bullata]